MSGPALIRIVFLLLPAIFLPAFAPGCRQDRGAKLSASSRRRAKPPSGEKRTGENRVKSSGGPGATKSSPPGAGQETTGETLDELPAKPDVERTFIGTEWREDEILERLKTAAPKRFRPVGHTSTVLKMTFREGPYHAAFKAATREKPRGYLAEVAAYRLARCLGLNNVPPAVTRLLHRKMVGERLEEEHAAMWPELEEQMTWTKSGHARGAAIFWVNGMRDLGLETRSGMRRVTEWLRIDGELPERKRVLAAELSTMLALDYLMGNGDRFSGGNLKGDQSGEHVIVRDHDMAFPPRLPDRAHRRILRYMLRVERFSHDFYRRLKLLTPKSFGKQLSLDPASAHRPLLDPRQVRGLFDRRATLLSHIATLISQHGEERVLVFP
jgi:hypothetical protein